ncbi:PspA/IM30 family protein [Sulfidibacter corallicola]|uniref:PspA/IM30 family protein n=1 Tax=Sulfidibacter corallicola TaxID=2818388 RepID=A0A8A4TD80_SULCO|nr:PspA/IM30 family protein [Sulfidibacter corallicola]QTD47623.1 PspA/IM30 family protein [Sulfidibacter corallicola]
MGIFSRISEIINSNVNAMLDKAEDPEKMVKLMIHEMEDTLTEVKSSAAEVVADRIRTTRLLENETKRQQEWATKAQLAVKKGRDDLAREALEQKLDSERKCQHYKKRLDEVDVLASQYQSDISRLEEKLANARARQRMLIASHQSAVTRRRVEEKIYKLNTTGAFAKFENYEKRIDRFQAEAEVMSISNNSLEKKFVDLVHGEEIEAELQRLKGVENGENASELPSRFETTSDPIDPKPDPFAEEAKAAPAKNAS